MKIRRLNEDAKRFYVDEIVSAPGGKTETERHSFATIGELKQYCKDAGLTKDDIANCGGCDVKDLCESYADVKIPRAVKEFIDNLCNEINADVQEESDDEDSWSTEYGYNENLWDRGTGGDYNMYGKPSSYYADEVMESVIEEFGDVLKTDEQKLAVYCYVEFMDEPEWVDTLAEETEGNLHIQCCPSCGCQNDYSDSQDNGSWVRYTCSSCGNTWDIDKPQTKDTVKEEVEKLHTKPNGEYLVKADSGKGYTAFSRDNVAIGGIDNEDADSDDKAIDKFKRNEYSECLNEAYFDTAEYRIQKYEDDIPELMAGMHDDYMEGKLDAARYAEVLKKVYDALADCDYKHTMSSPVVRKSPSERMLDRLKELDSKTMNDAARENLDELFDIKVDAKGFGGSGNNMHVGPGSMPLTASVENSGEEETLNEGSEKYYAAKYTAVDSFGNKIVKKICFRCDGTIEDAEKEVDAVINEPYIDVKVIGSVLKGVAEKDGYQFVESTDTNEYDDDYSDDYDESLEECSGIKAHKVIMGEGIDDIGLDGDLGEEGPTGDKTEDIEFVMEEYIAESLLIDFVEKVDALTYKVGANDQVVTVVFDPKWSEYVYTIDGKGPYSHRSYEFISRDIYDYVMSTTNSDYELDDIVD